MIHPGKPLAFPPLLLDNILIRVEIEDGGRKAKVKSCGLGKQVAWETYRALPESM